MTSDLNTPHPVVGIDASNVYPKLWIGSKPPTDRKLPAFSLIVLCAVEYQPPQMACAGRVIRAPLDDAEPTEREVRMAVAAAARVADELRAGGRVLSTCYAGLNRSALVAAIGLMNVCRMPVPEIIHTFRRQRGEHCLSNEHFVQVLHRIDRGRRKRAPR
jgi:protein-tyrosine phosphatase